MKRVPVYVLGKKKPERYIEVDDDAEADCVVRTPQNHLDRLRHISAVVVPPGGDSKPTLDRDDLGRFTRGLPDGMKYSWRTLAQLYKAIADELNYFAKQKRERGPKDITGPFQLAERVRWWEIFWR